MISIKHGVKQGVLIETREPMENCLTCPDRKSSREVYNYVLDLLYADDSALVATVPADMQPIYGPLCYCMLLLYIYLWPDN